MSKSAASTPFKFSTCLYLTESLGRKAKNIPELITNLKEVPESSVYYHTHHFLQQHQYLSPEPSNDFGYWARNVLADRVLGEKLFSIDILQFAHIEELRKELIHTLEEHVNSNPEVLTRFASSGQELYFLKSIHIILSLPYEAHNLEEFYQILKEVTVHSIYFHMFDSKLRLGKNDNDFSSWLRTSLEEKELASKISRLDPYTYTLEELRSYICSLIKGRMQL